MQCGNQLQSKFIEGRDREFCPVCGWINYEHLKVSAGCRIVQDGRLLLVLRKNPPFQGTWHFPSGYVEVDERPVDAAVRETREECGLIVEAGKLAGAYYYDDDDRGNGVVMFYDARVVGGRLQPSDETSEIRYFSQPELIKLNLAGMSAHASIQDWIQEQAHV
jgi:ADP-ribose pyrophosphatase YjhB (NUDIX family)